MKEERLFAALSGVDEALLARSERTQARRPAPWIKWGAAAACLALALAGALWLGTRDGGNGVIEGPDPTGTVSPPPVSEPPVVESPGQDPEQPVVGGEAGLHLLQLGETAGTPDFVIYINPEQYTGREENGAYVIRPIIPLSGDMPECKLEISHLSNTDLSTAADAARAALLADYKSVGAFTSSPQTGGLTLHGEDGVEWNDRQVDLTVVDDGRGGVFLFTSCYFTEATEGHGGRFADMLGTFQVLSPGDDDAPAGLARLKETVSRLMPALFAGDLSAVGDLLAPDAMADGYEEDMSGEVTVSAVDYTVDGASDPATAVVSVKHRMGPEDSFTYLTMELTYTDGQWLLNWAGLEK